MNKERALNHYQVGEFLFDSRRGILQGTAGEKRLEPQVNALLKLMVEMAGETVGRQAITEHIWPDRVVGDDALRAMVKKLRDAFGDDARNPSYIRTEPLKGYVLIAPVRTAVPIPSRSSASTLFGRSLAALTLVIAGGIFVAMDRSKSAAPAGPELELLTRMPGSEVSPDYNPVTNRLLFSHRANKDDSLQLYVKDLASQRVHRLTWDTADYANALWSPDGQKLAYSRSQGSLLEHYVATFHPERGIIEERLLTIDGTGRFYLISWGTDGNSIYLKSAGNDGAPMAISRIDLDSGQVSKITSPNVDGIGDFFARESRNGKMLALLREVSRSKRELIIMDISTGALLHTRLLTAPYSRLTWTTDDEGVILSGFSGELVQYRRSEDQLVDYPLREKYINDVFFSCGENCFYMRQHNGNFLDLQVQPNPFLQRSLMASGYLDLAGAEDFPVFAHHSKGHFFASQSAEGISILFQDDAGDLRELLQLKPGSTLTALQVNEQDSYLTGLIDSRVFLLEIETGELDYLTNAVDPAGPPTWSTDGEAVFFSKKEKEVSTLFRYSLTEKRLVPAGHQALVMRQLNGDLAILVDDQRQAWLSERGKSLHLLTKLPSESPNRWLANGSWLYYTAHEGNTAVMFRINLEGGQPEKRVLAKNRFRLHFDLNRIGDRALFVKSLLAESNLVKVSLPQLPSYQEKPGSIK